jgi:hypothetical protein
MTKSLKIMQQLKRIVLAYTLLIISIYWTMPVFNYGFWGVPFYFLLAILIYIVFSNKISVQTTGKNQQKINFNTSIPKAFYVVIGVIVVYMTLVPVVTSWSLFHHQSYRNLLGKVEIGKKFSDHMEPISIKNIRVVDEELASILGDKVLGAQPALGSQVILGEFTIQKVKEELYWVAPLEHSGFFKWNKNKQGTPGYVMVNATNERDVKLVENVNGKAVKIKYQPNAFFNDNLERHIYFHGYMTHGLTDYSFEIDDQGNPFWVVTKFTKKIGFYGSDATSVLVVNATTGQINEYNINKTPDWIDRLQPEKFIEEQINDWGEYVHGYWNFSSEGKLQITENLTLVYGEDNKSYWYTGLTSVGADESTVGFILIDTRTKKAVWYKQSGATETAAMGSAEGKVQEKGYTATIPTPYNINNIPTYVMTLKDDGGLVKMYAMVSIQDYTIVGVGNSLQETLMSFKNAFNASGNKFSASTQSNKITVKSVVNRINSDVKNGNSFYYFTLAGNKNIFIGSTQISNEIPLTSIGDSVEIVFENDSEQMIGVSGFKNISLK